MVTRVLFVCTGNVFRSFSAEKCLQKYLEDKGITNIVVDSAGISKHIGKRREPVHPETRRMLKTYGIDPRYHRRKKITKKIVQESDVIIAMSFNHQEYIKKHFGIDVPLFYELIGKGHKPVKDIPDVIHNWQSHPVKTVHHIDKIVTFIHDNTPRVYATIKKKLKS